MSIKSVRLGVGEVGKPRLPVLRELSGIRGTLWGRGKGFCERLIPCFSSKPTLIPCCYLLIQLGSALSSALGSALGSALSSALGFALGARLRETSVTPIPIVLKTTKHDKKTLLR